MGTKRLLVIAFISSACIGCVPKVVTRYVTVEVEKKVYVPIPAQLTETHIIDEGPLSACPQIAFKRKVELEKCNIDKRAIIAVSGNAAASE